MKAEKTTKIIDNDAFVAKNFEKLVEKYGGQTIVICNGEIFTGDDDIDKALAKYPKSIPLVFNVPRPEFFAHHFIL